MADIIEEITKERLWNRNYVKVWSANFMLFLSFMLLTPLLPLYLKEQFGAGGGRYLARCCRDIPSPRC